METNNLKQQAANYKIKVTAENREAIKEIANRKGMNENNLDFTLIEFYYEIIDNQFRCRHEAISKDNKELTFDQLKAMFDKQESLVGRYFKALVNNAQASDTVKNNYYKIEEDDVLGIKFKGSGKHKSLFFLLDKEHENKYYELMPIGFDPNKQETDLEKWLRETKAKNLSLEELTEFIAKDKTCSVDIYIELEKLTKGRMGKECAKILYNQWNEPKPQVEYEIPYSKIIVNKPKNEPKPQGKIIGYKAPFDLGGHEVKGLTFKLTPSNFGKWYQCSYGDSHELSEIILPSEIVETWEPVFEAPTEKETTTISLENFIRNSIDKNERMQDYSISTETVRILLDQYKEMYVSPSEKTFKDKVIELIEAEKEKALFKLNESVEQKNYLDAHAYSYEWRIYNNIVQKIKELN